MKKHNLNRGFGPLVIIIVVAAVLAVGGGTYYTSKSKKERVDSQNELGTQSDNKATIDASIKVGTLRSLLSLGQDVVCTFSGSEATGNVSGTMFISGEMMRGDFTAEGTESHMIRQGNDTFVWSGNQGAKMNFSQTSTNSSGAQSSVNLDQEVNYKCDNWSKDSSKFDAPSNVNFIDLNTMMNGQLNLPTQVDVSGGVNGSLSY